MEQTPYTTPFTVEINHRYNPINKQWHNDIFIKLYTAALDSGFLAAISDRDWKTLCVLALHMDADGQCYPSRDHIARALGVNPSTASDRIQRLMAFRWQGQPLVQVTRERQPDGTLGRQVYTILPIVPLGFGPQKAPPDPKDHDRQEDLSPEDKTADAETKGVGRDEQGDPGDPPIRSVQPVSTMSGFPNVVTANMDHPNVVDANVDGSDMAEAPSRLSYAHALNKIQVKQDPGQTRTPINKIQEKQEPKAEKKTHEQPPAVRKDSVPQKDGVLEQHNRTPEEPEGKKNTRRRSPEAQALTTRLKTRLQSRGVTVFPRDWALKGQASAESLLRTLSVSDVEALIDWTLSHPFWGLKVTAMHQLITIAPQWQQQRNRQATESLESQTELHRRSQSAPIRPGGMSVAARNAALLQHLYSQTAQEGNIR